MNRQREIERRGTGCDEVEAAVVGGTAAADHAHLHLIGVAQRRPSDVALGVDLFLEAVAREVEVDRSGLGVDGLATRACFVDRVEALLAGEMDHVNRAIGHARQLDGALRSDAF